MASLKHSDSKDFSENVYGDNLNANNCTKNFDGKSSSMVVFNLDPNMTEEIIDIDRSLL